MRFLPLSLHVSRSMGTRGKKKREWRRSSRDKHNGKSLMETLCFLHYTRRERSCLRNASLFGKIAFSLSKRLALPPPEDRASSFRTWSKLYYDVNELIGFKNTPRLSFSLFACFWHIFFFDVSQTFVVSRTTSHRIQCNLWPRLRISLG